MTLMCRDRIADAARDIRPTTTESRHWLRQFFSADLLSFSCLNDIWPHVLVQTAFPPNTKPTKHAEQDEISRQS